MTNSNPKAIDTMRQDHPDLDVLDDFAFAKEMHTRYFQDKNEDDFLARVGVVNPIPKEEVPQSKQILTQMRKDHPLHEDMDDVTFAKEMHTLYFPDKDKDEFFQKVGVGEIIKAQKDETDARVATHKQRWKEKVSPYIPDLTGNIMPIAKIASLFTEKTKEPKPTPTENFVLGGVTSLSSYAASASKLAGNKELQKKFNDVKEFSDQQIKENDGEVAGFVGEMIVDPFNLAPAGLATKGTKLARVGKSMVGGAAVGASTMAAKNFGDEDLTDEEKDTEMAIGAGFVSVLNGIISGVTKGRVDNAIKDIPELQNKTADEIVDTVTANPEKFGMTSQEAQEATFNAQEFLKSTKAPKASEELGLIDEGWSKLADEIAPELKPVVDDLSGVQKQAETIIEPTPTKEPTLQELEVLEKENLRKATFKESIDQIDEANALREEAIKYAQQAEVIKQQKVDEILQHPRIDELLEMQKDVLAKDNRSPQRLVSPRRYRELDGYNGTDKHAFDAAVYEKNYGYDFSLTKRDVEKIQKGKIDSSIISKLENDLGVLDNHPDWSVPKTLSTTAETKPLTPEEWEEANSLFAKGADNVAVGVFAGIEEDEEGNITFDPEKFIIGLGGYTAVKAALKNKQVQGKLKEYAQKAVDAVDMNPQVHKESGFNAMFVGAKADEAGAFSDVATKKTMREIDDSQINYKPIPKQKVEYDGIVYEQNYANLGEIIDHPELFKKYPELKDLQVSINDRSGRGGSYNHGVDAIALDRGNVRTVISDEEKAIRTKIRELDANPIDDEYTRLNAKFIDEATDPDDLVAINKAINKTPTAMKMQELQTQLYKVIDDADKSAKGAKDLTDNGKSILLHEIQHAIQGREGWARGGSPDDFVLEANMHKAINEEISKIDSAIGYNQWFEENIESIPELLKSQNGKHDQDFLRREFAKTLDVSTSKKYLDKLQEARKIQKENKELVGLEENQFDTPYNLYRRLHGEQQARATQQRMNMTPEQRASEDWTKTLEKNEGAYVDPILRYDDGVSMSTSKDTSTLYNKLKAGKLPQAKGLPDETKAELMQRKLQDKFNRVKKLINAKADFEKIDDTLNPYQAEELMHGRVEARIQEFEASTVTPIVEKIAKAKLTIDQVDEYLWARHAPERNAKMLENHGKENGSGLSDAEAFKIIEKYADNQAMQEIAQDVYTMNRDRLKTIYNEGLESADFVKMLDEYYDNYVPLRREFADKESVANIGKGFDIKGKETKRAKGSDRAVESPLMHSILAYEETIVRAEKNEVGKTFLNFAEAFPDYTLYKIRDIKHIPQYNQDGAVVGMNPNYSDADNVLHVKVDGKVKEIELKDPALASAFKNLNAEQMNGILKASQVGVRFLAALNTSYSPEFVVSNFTRDIQTAMINMPDGIKGNRATILKDVMPAMKGIYSSVRDGNKNEWSVLFEEMKREGGTTGWNNLHSVLDIKKSTQKSIDKYSGKVMPTQKFKDVLQHIDDINSAVENSSRLVAYKMAKESGMTNKKAASIAKNLTVNFNRKGEAGTTLNALYMFYNASIQGSTRMIQQLAKSKTSQAIVGGIVGMGVGLDMYNRSQNEDAYNLLPDYLKDTNYIIMNQDGTYQAIKLPYGYNVFKALGDMTSKVMHGEMDATSIPSRLLSISVHAFSPIGVDTESPVNTIMPSLIKPAIEISENRNFMGTNIYPEQNPFRPNLPDSQVSYKSTNPLAKGTAEFLNRISGGTMYESGAIDIHPDSIEHIVETATGGLGQFMLRTGTVIDQAIDSDKEVDINKVPFLRGVYGVPREKAATHKVYNMYKESSTKKFSDIERDRFYKWAQSAKDEGHINRDEFKRVRDHFKNNQMRIDFAEKNRFYSIGDYKDGSDVREAAYDGGLKKNDRKEIERTIKKMEDKK